MSATAETAVSAVALPRKRAKPRRTRARRISDRLISDLVLPLAFAVTVLLLWEGAVMALDLAPYILPAPSKFFTVLFNRFDAIMMMAQQTARSTLIGFALGVGIGLLTGGIIGSSRLVYDTVYPSLIAIHAIPSVALVPLLVVWFGAGPHIAIIMSVIVSFFPVTVIVSTAIASSSPELDDVLRSLGARKIDVLLKVSIPRAMPQFFGSIKLAITGALIGTIVAETIAANKGIGYVMVVATNRLDGTLAFAGLTVLSVMGVTLYIIAITLEKRLTGWAYRRQH
jgi:NitT/TauT family transport system permease protein